MGFMGYFPGLFLDTFFNKMVAEMFFSNALHNFAKGRVISKCKNDKP